MSNRIELVATTFINVTGERSYGYRLYDDYEKTYGNLHEAIIEDDMQLLAAVIGEDEHYTVSLLEEAKSAGIYVNGTWYDAEEIAHVFKQPTGES